MKEKQALSDFLKMVLKKMISFVIYGYIFDIYLSLYI